MTASAPRIFQFAAGQLEDRLAAVLALPAGSIAAVETTALGGNAWSTAFVARHRIRFAGDSRPPLDVVEKKLRKVPGASAGEPVMQAWAARLAAGDALLRTPHLGVIETPLASFLYAPHVTGAHAHLVQVAVDAGAGIAKLESASATHLRALAGREAASAWRMDFFRPWTRWRPRYNLSLALHRLRDAPSPEFRRSAHELDALLRRLGPQVQASPRCLSHLDLISKNLIVHAGGLHLIDWGEARIGRFGFDAGSYLHRLLRANDLATYGAARDVFVPSYFAQLPSGADPAQVRGNLAWFLALRTLCYFLRPGVLRQHRATPRAVEEKLALLLAGLQAAA